MQGLDCVSNSNGVNSNLNRYLDKDAYDMVSNSNGVNSNMSKATAVLAAISGFKLQRSKF